MNHIEFNYKKLRIAQDLNKKTIDTIGMKLMKINDNGIYQLPDDNTIFSYINNLASKRKIKHYVLKGEYEDIYLFDNDEIISQLEVLEIQANKFTEIIKIQCYDEKVGINDNLPIELSNIHNLFKLPKTLFNSGTCIYFLCRTDINGVSSVVYVGQSENVHQRLVGHMATKIFDQVFYLRVQGNKMNKIEEALIAWFKPEYNKNSLDLKGTNKSISLAESILNINKFQENNYDE